MSHAKSSSRRWNESTKKRKREGNEVSTGDGANDSESSPIGGSIPLTEVKESKEYLGRISHSDAPKRKYALCIAYLGTAYRGLQVNPGILTVEAMLEKALFLAGGIEEANYGDFYKVSWSRAGRTDKGVHAVTNCCSMKLHVPLGEETKFITDVNTFLPEDIRLLTMTRTMKNFGAKFYCSGRLYKYLLPTYVLSSVAVVNKVFDDVVNTAACHQDIGSDSNMKSDSMSSLTISQLKSIHNELKSFRLSKDGLTHFRAILQKYLGTHKFHNFTSDKSSSDASAKRYIISIDCSEPMLFGDNPVEWVCISLRGQSFLLNQVIYHCIGQYYYFC